MRTSTLLLSLAAVASATNPPPGCAYEQCFWKDKIPQEWKAIASKYCKLIVAPATLTSTAAPTIKTAVSTVAQPPVTVTTAATNLVTFVSSVVCQASSATTVSASTYRGFVLRGQPPNLPASVVGRDAEARDLEERQDTTFLAAGCKKKPTLEQIKAACRCFVAPVVSTVRPTSLVTVKTTLPASTVISTVVVDATTIQTTCTSTSSPTYTAPGPCGVDLGSYTASTAGAVTCTPIPSVAPKLNVALRVEANEADGTVFDGCVVSGSREITLQSGGTHQCGVANRSPITAATYDAGLLNDFTLDGTFSPSFNDYFITRIFNTAQQGNQYWGVLSNGVFTTSGGCGATLQQADRGLWLWDAFTNGKVILSTTPEFAVAEAGKGTVSVSITARSPNGGASSPFAGATLAGQTSDANGNVNIPIPSQPGCYLYKATSTDTTNVARSQTFYLNVVQSFTP